VADLDHQHDKLGILDALDDAVLAHADAPERLRTSQLRRSGRSLLDSTLHLDCIGPAAVLVRAGAEGRAPAVPTCAAPLAMFSWQLLSSRCRQLLLVLSTQPAASCHTHATAGAVTYERHCPETTLLFKTIQGKTTISS
jgi:hypothetical protein